MLRLICAAYGVAIAIVVVRGAIAVTAALVLSEFLLLLAFAAKKVRDFHLKGKCLIHKAQILVGKAA